MRLRTLQRPRFNLCFIADCTNNEDAGASHRHSNAERWNDEKDACPPLLTYLLLLIHYRFAQKPAGYYHSFWQEQW